MFPVTKREYCIWSPKIHELGGSTFFGRRRYLGDSQIVLSILATKYILNIYFRPHVECVIKNIIFFVPGRTISVFFPQVPRPFIDKSSNGGGGSAVVDPACCHFGHRELNLPLGVVKNGPDPPRGVVVPWALYWGPFPPHFDGRGPPGPRGGGAAASGGLSGPTGAWMRGRGGPQHTGTYLRKTHC